MVLEKRRLAHNRDTLYEIMTLEKKYLKDKKTCIRSKEQDIRKCLCSKCSYGLYDGGKLVAFSLCYYSDYCTGYVEKCFVHPSYRGKGLQRFMLRLNISSLIKAQVDEIFSMVSPYNIASIKSFSKEGFDFKKMVVYDNQLRMILKNTL